jgi:ADP-ribosylglycohydrolase
MNEAYQNMMIESDRRARLSGYSTIKYWIENDVEAGIEEMPKPNYRPVSYIKVSLLWAFYYLKQEYKFEDAIRDIIKRGGDTMANASIVGGLIGAGRGTKDISQQYRDLLFSNKANDIESQPRAQY